MLETEQSGNEGPLLPQGPDLPRPTGFIDGITSGITKLVAGIRNGYRDDSLTLDPPRIHPTLQLEYKEHSPGVLISRSENTGDVMVVFMGLTYLQNLDYLKDASAQFLSRNAKWELGFCRELMDKGMGVDELTWGLPLNDETIARIRDKKKEAEIPSVFLFREDAAPEGQYHAISVQRKLFIETDNDGVVSVLDHVLRAVEPGYRRKGRGRDMVELALFRHGGAMFYTHKTGNPLAAYINAFSKHLLFESSHPWSSLEITDPLMAEVRRKSARHIMLQRRRMLPNGVIKGDYPKPNKGFNPAELYGDVLDFYKMMKDPDQLGMRLEEDKEGEEGAGYDSVAPLFRVV